MAIDPNILLKGIVPDVGSAISQGYATGQKIKEAPVRARLLDQKVASGDMEEGIAKATALANLAGDDLTAEDLMNEATYSQLVRTAQDLGVPVKKERFNFSPQNAADLYKIIQGGRQIRQQSTSGGYGFTEGEVVTKQVGTRNVDGSEIPVFKDIQIMNRTDTRTGTAIPVEIDLTGEYVGDSPLNSRKIALAQSTAGSKVLGKELAMGSTADQRRQREADDIAAKKEADIIAEELAKGDIADTKREREALDSKAKSMAEDAAQASTRAFETANLLEGQIGTFESGITALEKGAETGFLAQYLPNAKAATIELQSAINQSGLDAISLVTLGAISKSELDLVLKVGIPGNMDEKDLLPYLKRKVAAIRKVQSEVRRMGEFLSEGTNTLADWNRINNSNVKTKTQKKPLNKKQEAELLREKYGIKK